MTQDPVVIVSADCHAGPARMSDYRDYMDAALLPAFDDYVARVDAFDAAKGDANARGGAPPRAGEEGLWDGAVRERYLDADGVSGEIIYTQGAAPFGRYPAVAGNPLKVDYDASPKEIAAGCRAYNRWLADLCARDAKRHFGVAKLPVPDVEASVAEVEWARNAGLRGGVLLPPTSEDYPKYNDPMYEPLWAACEAHEMTVNLHGGAAMTYGPGPEATSLILMETDWLSRRSLWFLIFSGVFERHPKLHLALTEQRTHWAAPMLREMDSIADWPGNRGLRQRLTKRPSDYFKANCFIGASFMSRLECDARADVGADRLMWGSDYPHQEGAWPWTDISLRWTFGGGVPSDELRAMLGGNAIACYHLDREGLRSVAERVGPAEAALRTPVEQLPSPEGMPSWAFRTGGPWH